MVEVELSRAEKREVYIRVKVGFMKGPESIVWILIDLETVLADPATATDPAKELANDAKGSRREGWVIIYSI